MASEAEEKARRVRSLLSSYYGSSGDAPFASGARVPAEPIDAPDFDAERYVRETLERTPLDALRKKCASMREEARRLDGDAQTLVYDNYSTFIAAADAVSDVRVKARAMEEKMAEAKALISRTVTKAEAVDQNLSARRDTVLALSGVRNLIQKLRRAFDVPEKMRAALDRGAPTAAAHYYAAVRPLLEKHGDRGAFVAVKRLAEVEAARARSEIGEAMARAATRAADAARARRTAERGETATMAEDFGIAPMDATENSSTNPSTNPSTTVGAPNDAFEPEREKTPLNLSASECVALLAKLGAPRGESRAAFVRSHRAPMERALALGESSVSSPAGRTAIHADPRAFVARLDGDFLEAFHRFAGEYLEVFGDDDEDASGRDARGELVDAGRPLFARYFALVKLALDSSAAETAETSRVGSDAASSRLVLNPRLVPAKGLMAALATMAADLSSAHRLVPRLGLGDRAAEVVERAVRGRVRAAFHALETKLVRALDELETVASLASESRLGIPSEVGASVKKNTFGAARETAALRETLARVAAVFAGGVAEALADARALLEERPVMVMGWRAEFEGLVRAESQTVVRATLARLAAAGVASGACGAPPPKALRVESDDRSPLAEAARRGRDVSATDVSATDSETAAETEPSARSAESIDGSQTSSELVDPSSFDPLFALACARTAAFVRDEGVDAVATQLDLCFPPREREPDAARAIGTSPVHRDEPESAAEISRARADEAALFLAAAFARARGDAAAAMLRRTMRTVDWAEAREPRDVRPVADVLLEEMARVDAEAGAILSFCPFVLLSFSETGFQGDKNAGVSEPSVPTLAGSEVGTDSGRGFVPRSCARAAVTVSVVRFVLRAFSEMLSATPRFSRGGFHQTELDLAFLKPRLVARGAAASPADAKAVDDLLSECVAAAAARTVDPAPLDSAIVARILDAKQSRGGG